MSRILIGCEKNAKVREAFKALGHIVMSCDIQASTVDGWHYQGDIFNVLDMGWDMAIFFPPCTYLTNAGVRHFNVKNYGDKAIKRHQLRLEAAEFVDRLYRSSIPKICIENPVGWLNNNWRKPDQVIHPYYFGDPHVKRTCLWLKGLPLLKYDRFAVKPEPLSVLTRRPGKLYAGGEAKNNYFIQAHLRDSDGRSETFRGIADAMAAQWGNLLPVQHELFN